MATVDLGVDLGGTAVRAAYGPDGEAAGFIELKGPQWPWLLCRTPARPGARAAFPSLKSRLGLAPEPGPNGRPVDPAAVFTRALAELRDRVTAAASADLGHTVIAVPVGFSTRQRTALLVAAREAGLGEALLLSDSLAAVIGHRERPSGTYLVLDMGYSRAELGLIRASRSGHRALGYEIGEDGGGAALDDRVLESLLDDPGGGPPPADQASWLRLRQAAEDVKEGLTQGNLRLTLPEIGRRLHADGFAADVFAQLVRELAAASLDLAEFVLDQSGTDWNGVTRVLLAGGTAAIPAVAALVADRGLPYTVLPPRALAVGALRHARSQSTEDAPVADRPLLAEEGTAAPAPPRLKMPLTTLPEPVPGDLAEAHRLLAQGRLDEAADAARKTLDAARDLLRDIETRRPRATADTQPLAQDRRTVRTPADDARRLSDRARRRAAEHRYDQAVDLFHKAWRRDPDDQDLFDEMIRAHCDAAMHEPDHAKYEVQIGWLKCAYRHDTGNPRVLDLLAERTFLHSKELNRLGRRGEAVTLLDDALRYNPDHRGAAELLRLLRGGR
ncbi:Hsp70 family protein [Glycomyces sp. NPDC046736]|uniref:Hsp70 family protein n=1 Tax=Glycomyces sp. NPDC046736 TaxID=3155615 RepID=UPI0033C3FCCD